MANARKRRAARHRARVDRAERIKPPPEAAQHHRPWPMQLLLMAGPEHGGIDSDEFEAALQIVETYRVLTAGLGMAGLSFDLEKIAANYSGSMSDRDAERCSLWFDWSMRLPVGFPARLVAWIEDEQRIESVRALRQACHLWDRIRADRAKQNCPRSVDSPPAGMRLTKSSWLPYGETTAGPANLPVQRFQRFSVSPAIECRSSSHSGQNHRPSIRTKSTDGGR